jgi:hypothetical protein
VSAGLYREFTLRGPSEAGAMLNFVKSNAKAFAEKGAPLRVIVTEDEMDRLDEQIRYYFGVVIKALAEQAWVEGRQFSKEAWHELMARKFLPGKEIVMPDGEIIVKRASIAKGQIGVKAMAKFTNEVEAYAATEHGVGFE